eukprot:4885793-Amphidinium_carterae.2
MHLTSPNGPNPDTDCISGILAPNQQVAKRRSGKVTKGGSFQGCTKFPITSGGQTWRGAIMCEKEMMDLPGWTGKKADVEHQRSI